VSPAREIGVGLLGVGWMGEVHSTSYRRVPIHFPESTARARLVVAADQVEERARAAADRLGYERSATDWRAVVQDPEVEAISICAPNFLHREMAITAAEAGKHFWGEEPLGALPEDTLAIAAATEAADVRTIVGLNYRHPPAVQHARRLVAEGALGEPSHFRMQFLASYSANPRAALSWRFSRELSGHGILSDLGSHAIDLAQFLLGRIVATSATSAIVVSERPKVPMGTGTHFTVVEGEAEMGVVENEDWTAALVEFESGLRGTIELSRVAVGADARYVFEVGGTRGAVRWDFERMGELELHLPLETGDAGYARVVMGPGHPDFARFQPGAGIPMSYDDLKVIEAQLFLESIADGRQREPGAREIADTARVIAATARSFETGAWETVNR
jgi:predicted dehydrogenase